MNIAIDELAIPASMTEDYRDGEDSAVTTFRDATAVRNAVEAAELGTRELAYSASELLPEWLDPYTTRRLLVARVDGQIVGRAVYETIAGDTAPEAWATLDVLDDYRRLGIGGALLDRVEGIARAAGYRVVQGYQLTRARPETQAGTTVEMVPSPTGFGGIPRASAGAQFALSRGYVLEQVERYSRLPLPLDPAVLTAELATAEDKAGPDYRIVTWQGRTPEQWLDDIALLAQRMNTDAPNAGLDVTEEKWDAERVRAEDDRNESSPRTLLTAAAEHIPTGHLVAFTELSVPGDYDRSVAQLDTLVLREHRGHNLGMVVKAANLQQLEQNHPGYPSVTTFNAEENRHMLRVNEALGFVAEGYEGAWRTTL
jgi:GNAT superfamily N-acetyltransferase